MGNYAMIDDANIPSLLSIPYIGYSPADDEIYQKTEDITSALTNLGYQRTDAYRVASEICLKNPTSDLGTLIRLSLKEFNQ